MSDKQLPSEANEDETYLKIWQVEQDFVKTRWSISTFFMSISFATLGFSFQAALQPREALAIRIAGVFIYWFSLFMYFQFYGYTKFLRNVLVQMETSKRTRLNLQGSANNSKEPGVSGKFPSGVWLVGFGIVYILSVLLLTLLKL